MEETESKRCIVVRVFVAAGTFLPSCCLGTAISSGYTLLP
jgi:hypothetical protein